MGNTSVLAIKASSVTLLDLANETRGKKCKPANLTRQSPYRLIKVEKLPKYIINLFRK